MDIKPKPSAIDEKISEECLETYVRILDRSFDNTCVDDIPVFGYTFFNRTKKGLRIRLNDDITPISGLSLKQKNYVVNRYKKYCFRQGVKVHSRYMNEDLRWTPTDIELRIYL